MTKLKAVNHKRDYIFMGNSLKNLNPAGKNLALKVLNFYPQGFNMFIDNFHNIVKSDCSY